MDAVSLIDQHLNIEKLLNHYNFDHIRDEGNIMRAACKLHGGNNPSSFVMSKDRGLYYCHTQCGAGNTYQLIQKIERCSFPEAVRIAAGLFDVDIDGMQIINKDIKYVSEMQSFIKTIKNMRKKELVPFHIEEEIREVTTFRNFSEETLRHFGLGFASSITLKKRDGDEYTLHNRLVFPFIQQSVLIAVLLRRTMSNDIPKWSNQPIGLNLGNYLYNYDSVSGTPVIVCEGVTDVWAWYEIGLTAVATLGAHLTNEQYKLLLKTGLDIVLSYDGDEAGRTATQRAIKILKNKANISIVPFDTNEDPASIEREELKRRYENRIVCS